MGKLCEHKRLSIRACLRIPERRRLGAAMRGRAYVPAVTCAAGFASIRVQVRGADRARRLAYEIEPGARNGWGGVRSHSGASTKKKINTLNPRTVGRTDLLEAIAKCVERGHTMDFWRILGSSLLQERRPAQCRSSVMVPGTTKIVVENRDSSFLN